MMTNPHRSANDRRPRRGRLRRRLSLGCRGGSSPGLSVFVPLGLAALLVVVASALAQEEPDSANESALVLVDGRLIEGRIERTNDGYMVHRPGSKFLLLAAHVRVHGKNRRDAYLKLRRTYPLDRPDPHVELAQWCIAHGLLDDARRELREALGLAPNHAAARTLFDDLRAVAPGEHGGGRDLNGDAAGGIPLATPTARGAVDPAGPLPAGIEPLESRVLVTLEGRIVEGRITRNAGGYQVERTGARFVIPDAQVRVEAADRREAFDKMRGALDPRSPEPHVALARWCIGHAMLDEARIALLHALRLEPSHTDARSTLKRLEELRNPRDAAHLDRHASPQRTAAGFDPPAAVSLAGLPPEAAADFAARVQPLLMNKCGNASCHGRATGEAFRLEMVRPGRGTHRAATERNLAAVLRHIDRDRPGQSPLLTVPQSAHDRGRPVFRDHSATVQREILSDWVRKIAADLPQTPPPSKPFAAQPADDRNATASATAAVPAPASADRAANSRGANSSSPTSADEEFLKSILREERPDAFDPEEFNRRYRSP